jgi:hypothetical protein
MEMILVKSLHSFLHYIVPHVAQLEYLYATLSYLGIRLVWRQSRETLMNSFPVRGNRSVSSGSFDTTAAAAVAQLDEMPRNRRHARRLFEGGERLGGEVTTLRLRSGGRRGRTRRPTLEDLAFPVERPQHTVVKERNFETFLHFAVNFREFSPLTVVDKILRRVSRICLIQKFY